MTRADQERSQIFVPGRGTVPIPLDSAGATSMMGMEAKAAAASYSGASSDNLYKNGDVIDGKYEVRGFLGEGGMGAVYRVHHNFLGIELALKTFRTSKIDQEAWLRFQREAQAIGKLEHANIVRIYDFGITAERMPFYTMELLHGEPLSDRIQGDGPLSIKEAVRVFSKVASALAHAHACGIVHRDVKPANIYIGKADSSGSERNAVKLVDFGIAKLATGQNQALTSAGLIFGSPLYMSPEQAMGGEVDQRSDIYSLGCTIFECLTERTPFEGQTIIETLTMHQEERPPSLIDLDKGSDYPQRLEGLVRKMLAKSPENRYQSMQEVQRELESIALMAPRPQAPTQEISVAPRKVTKKVELQKPRSKTPLILAAVALTLFVGGYAIFATQQRGLPDLSKSDHTKLDEEFKNMARNAEEPSNMFRGAFFEVVDGKRNNFSMRNGKPSPNFDFPEPVGFITDLDDNKTVHAEIETSFPVEHRLSFEFKKFATNPGCEGQINRFAPNDIFEAVFGPDINPSHGFLSGLSHLTGLRSLSFRGSNLSPYNLIHTDGLQQIINLDFGQCVRLKSKAIARLSSLPRLNRICLDEMENITIVLEKLKTSHNLRGLKVDGCALTIKDCEIIADMPALEVLEANNCPIDLTRLKILSRSKTLSRLYLGATTLDKSAIPVLQQFSALRYLSIVPDIDRRGFRQALQKWAKSCDVELSESSDPDYSTIMKR